MSTLPDRVHVTAIRQHAAHLRKISSNRKTVERRVAETMRLFHNVGEKKDIYAL